MVLGDFDLTHTEVEDAMNSMSQEQLEVAVTWARTREAALVGPGKIPGKSPRGLTLAVSV